MWYRITVVQNYCGTELLWYRITLAQNYCCIELLWYRMTLAGASKTDYIVLNSTVRFKIISTFHGEIVFSTLFLVGMLSIKLFLVVLFQEVLTRKTYPLLYVLVMVLPSSQLA